MNREPDWSLWRSFAAVIEHGSLSGAARAIKSSQPTIGRHIELLESQLGLQLFERSLSGLKPNSTALKLYGPIAQAQTALAEANLMAEGAQDDTGGTVRITENILMREADIAIRMFRPTQLELVTKHLGDIELVPVAHERYLARRGRPTTLADLWQHDMLGIDRSSAIVTHAQKLGFSLTRENFVIRSDDQPHLWELMRAGLGIGFGQANLVRRTPGLVALPIDVAIPPLPIWLTTHRELYTSHRIRAVYDALAAGLLAYIEN
jgi:DNA-binding transcriptional LysR family regulator